jgi:hypothetical protein
MSEANACGTAGRGESGAGHAAPSALMLFVLQAGMVIAWSAGFIGYRFAAEHAPTFLVSFWRFALAVPLLLPFALPALRAASWAATGRQALIGVFAICGYLAPIVKSIEYGVPAGLAALAADLLPLAVAGLSLILPGRRQHRCSWRRGRGRRKFPAGFGTGMGLWLASGGHAVAGCRNTDPGQDRRDRPVLAGFSDALHSGVCQCAGLRRPGSARGRHRTRLESGIRIESPVARAGPNAGRIWTVLGVPSPRFGRECEWSALSQPALDDGLGACRLR